MKKSLRNIANGLLVAGVIAVVFANVGSLLECSTNGYCSVASIIFGIPEYELQFEQDFSTSVSTVAVSDQAQATSLGVSAMSGIVGTYLLTIAVAILLFLELSELYYLRKLFGSKLKMR